MNRLRYINPYYYIAMFFTWLDNLDRKSRVISAINEAEKQHADSGAKVLVFNTQNGVAVVKKNTLNGKQKQRIKGKAIYETK